MLNIRKRTAVIMVSLIFASQTWHMPAAASDELTVRDEIRPAIVLDPLERFRGAKSLSDEELVTLLKEIGFEGKALKVAWAVAKKESSGNPRNHNGNRNTGDNSYGIFQINMIDSLGEKRRDKYDLENNKELFDPVTNAEIAYQMSNGGKDWSAWKVYPGQKNGERYEMYLKNFPGN